ncbi:MAG: putative bifunctional diguanylate cyclase/phosphodiesterase [Gammaproteobacteria bacterium]
MNNNKPPQPLIDQTQDSSDYYRDLCAKLSLQLKESNQRQRQSLLDVRRAKLTNTLTRHLFRLKAARYSAEQVAERVLSSLARYMGVDCGALYTKASHEAGFETLAHVGFAVEEACDLSRKAAMPEFVCSDVTQDAPGVVQLVKGLTHTDKSVWCFHQASGLAVLLGSNVSDKADAWELSTDDRDMLHSLLELIANIVNDAGTRAEVSHELLDPLTGLPNRHMLVDHLERDSRQSRRSATASTAVLYLDIDRFALINEQFGHTVGDKVIVAVAHRLKELLRPGDMMARMGVDEFAIMAPGQRIGTDAELIATRILEYFLKPLRVAGHSFYISISIGVAETTPERAAVETLKDANLAMFDAKTKGGATQVTFGYDMRHPRPSDIRLEDELRAALAKQELCLYYQPIFSLQSNAVVAVEALVRWHHPTRGILLPRDFMALAQQSQLALDIGDWVIDKVIRDMNIWSSENERHKSISVCINIDESQFVQSDFVSNLGTMLKRGNIDPQRIRLELSERTLQACRMVEKTVLGNLSNMGVKLMLDDFGTGSSSLERLQSLPIDTIKIDGDFVRRMHYSRRNTKLLQAMVSLAQNLNKQIVAEGVEDSAQVAQLKEMGCDFIQGYVLGKPIAASRVGHFLNEQFSASGFSDG